MIIRRAGIVLLAALCALIFARPAAAAAPSPEDYRAAIHKALALVRRAADESDPQAERDTATGGGRRDRTRQISRLAGRRSAHPRQRRAFGRAALEGPTHRRRAEPARGAGRRAGALSAADHQAAREKLSQALDSLRAEPPQVNPILRWLSELLDRVLKDLWAGGASDTRWIWLIIGGVILVIALLYFWRHARRVFVAESALPPVEQDERPQSSTQALDNAQRLAGAGDYRAAVRQLYLGTLLILDERGKLRFDKTLTNHRNPAGAARRRRGWAGRGHAADCGLLRRGLVRLPGRATVNFDAYRARVESVRSL